MPNWKKVIVSGSDAALNSLNVTSLLSVTGSSNLTGSLDISGSASILGNTGTTTFYTNADTLIFTGSIYISGSIVQTGSLNITSVTSSLFGTASWAENAITSSHAVNALSASYALTASYALNGGGGGGGAITYHQTASAVTWSVPHTLNTYTPIVQVYDEDYNQLIPASVSGSSLTTVQITFSTTTAGYAVLSTGGSVTINISGSNATLVQSTPATTWSFYHGLNETYPVFTIFDNNDDVIVPLKIHADNANTASIYFSTARTGTAVAANCGLSGSTFESASWSAFAVSASYALTASYAENIVVSGAISNVDYIDFDTNVPYTLAEGRLGWDSGEGTLQLGLEGGNVTYSVGNQLFQYVYNAEATTMTKGQVVFVSGSQGNRIAVKYASDAGDPTSAGTLGLVAETITAGGNGWVITEGPLRNLNTLGLTAGSLLFLSSTPGAYTQSVPTAPSHSVRLGYVERVHASAGSIYIKIDNGYEIGELHDIVDTTTTASYGDLLVKSGSVWTNLKQLTGSYGLTGSLNVSGSTIITGSIVTTKGEHIKGYDAYTLTGYSLTPTSFNVGSLYNNDSTTFDGTSGLDISFYRSQPQYTLTGTGASSLVLRPFIAYPVVNLTGANARIDATGFTGFIWRSDPADVSTNGSNRLRGAYFIVGNRGGNGLTSAPYTNTVTGYEGSIENGGGTVNNMFGLRNYFWHGEFAANSTTNNNYGIYQGMTIGAASGGTHIVTNYYAFYQDTPSVLATGTLINRWGLYFTDPNMPSYHAGKFGIGKTAPAYDLDVSGSGNFTNGLTVTGSFQATSVTGSLQVTGNSTYSGSQTFTTGYIVLTQVSQSLNFVDDADAAANGVPLGGLYRNGNFIAIRIV